MKDFLRETWWILLLAIAAVIALDVSIWLLTKWWRVQVLL